MLKLNQPNITHRQNNSISLFCVFICFAVLSILISGCGEARSQFPEKPVGVVTSAFATQFNPQNCGTLTGTVSWNGDMPTVPIVKLELKDSFKFLPNPHSPKIQTTSKRIANAVVFLSRIDPAQSKPWGEVSNPTITANDDSINIQLSQRIGFVRLGQSIQLTSNGTLPHVIRGRGAMNFSIPFPDPAVPANRITEIPGHIELTSGSNIAPAIAHLFAIEHPYYTVTNLGGEFILEKVPAGNYELVIWLPNWNIIGHDRNPETGLICRYYYDQPFTKSLPIHINANERIDSSATLP